VCYTMLTMIDRKWNIPLSVNKHLQNKDYDFFLNVSLKWKVWCKKESLKLSKRLHFFFNIKSKKVSVGVDGGREKRKDNKRYFETKETSSFFLSSLW